MIQPSACPAIHGSGCPLFPVTHRQASERLGHEVSVGGEHAGRRRQRRVLALQHAADHLEVFAEQDGAPFDVDAEGRELRRSVARRHTQHQPAARQLVDRGSRLGHMQRVPQRQHDGARGQRNRLRVCRDPAEVHPGIVDLTEVAEARIAQRHVAHPQGGISEGLGALREPLLVVHRRLIALEGFDGEEDAEREAAYAKHATKAWRFVDRGHRIDFQHALSCSMSQAYAARQRRYSRLLRKLPKDGDMCGQPQPDAEEGRPLAARAGADGRAVAAVASANGMTRARA